MNQEILTQKKWHNLHCHCFSTIYQLIISLMMTSSLLYRRPVTLLFCEKFLVHSEDADDFKFVIQKTSHFFWGRISWFIQRVLIFFLMTTYNITTFIIEYFFLTLEGLITNFSQNSKVTGLLYSILEVIINEIISW
jgi:hypothetical protein